MQTPIVRLDEIADLRDGVWTITAGKRRLDHRS
jgi:hypothetical protein